MKNRQVLEIHQALLRLDGHPNDNNTALIPYQFTGNAAYAIGKNIGKTTPIVNDIQGTYNRLLKSLLQPGEIGLKKGDERILALTEEHEKVLDEESDYQPHVFKLSGLNINHNRIPPSAIAVLDPLIVDDTEDAVGQPPGKP